ncbi:MAG: hypothetical protein WEB63_03605 [Cucumibacter sp.]
MTIFEIFRSRQNQDHYVAILKGDRGVNADGVRRSDNLEPLLTIPDDGAPRIAFDANAARKRIADHGFYAFSVTIELRERAE